MREHLETALPIRLSQFLSAANDNVLRKTLAQATVPELVFAIRHQIDRMPAHQRGLMAMLAAGAIACCAGEEAGHA